MANDNSEQSYLTRLKFDPKLLLGPVASYLKNFRITILITLSIVFLGIISYLNLPKRLNPEVKIPIVTVVTVLPGAGPEDIESLITIPIENALQSLKGLDTLSSSSSDNVSVISVQFTSSTDRDKAKDDVQSAVDGVNTLPSDAQDPQVAAIDFENQPVWQFALSGNSDIASLQTFAKQLEDRLEDDPKIDHVSVAGLEEQEIVVELSEEKVANLGFNPLVVSQAIRAGISSYPAGTIDTVRNTYALTINPQIESVNDIRDVRINVQGSTVRLGDVAVVSERSKPQQTFAYIARHGEEPQRVVSFSVFKTLTTTITDGAEASRKIVNAEIAPHKDQFHIETISNTADDINKQFADLIGEFRTTIILVFVCLFIFLGLRQAVISSFTVPLTFLSAFAIMPYLGMSINFLTLFAFLLALGLLVDDTIVVISAMTTYYRSGRFTPYETGLVVWRDTIVPIWSTTITTIWSFVPLLLATGIIGEFIKPIPIVVTITMISSTAIAVLITLPVMIIILKPDVPRRVVTFFKIVGIVILIGLLFALFKQNPLFPLIAILYFAWAFVVYKVWRTVLSISKRRAQQNSFLQPLFRFITRSSDQGIISIDGFAEWYKRLITRILASKSARRKVIIAIVAYAVIGFMLVPAGMVKNEFFPKEDTERLFVQLELPAGTTSDRTEATMMKLLSQLKETHDVDFALGEVGGSAPTGFGGGGGSKNNQALITLHLPPKEDRKSSSLTIAEELRKTYGNEMVSIVEESGGPPAGSDLQIELSGNDLSALNSYADTLVNYLSTKPGVTNARKSVKEGTSAISFVPDKNKLAQAGLSIDSLGLWTRIYGSGFSLGEVNFDKTKTEKTPVRFTFGKERPTPDSFGRVSVPTQTGSIPLLSLGTLNLKTNPTSINRTNGKRTLSVSAGVRPGFNSADLNKDLEKQADELRLPEGYSWKTGGANEENAKSVQSIIQAMGVAALLILVTMVLQFRSFRQAVIVLIVIPLAVSSVFYVFAITGTPLSFPALIGVLSLFGIVVTNSMFIVDKMNLNQKEGMPFDEALADAGASRMEPIILTKLCTVLGLLPITLSTPLWRGLGGAIISGLLIASTIMLLFIPVVYYQWMKPKE